jgi:hypothetical protein
MKRTMAILPVLVLVLITGCAKVTGVSVSPEAAPAVKGETLQLSAAVEGTGNPRQNVVWEIVEPVSEGTGISAEGLLTVATGEEAFTLTVRAVSAADKSKSGTASLTLVPSRESVYGGWRVRRNENTLTITLAADSLTGRYSGGQNYTLEDLSWLPAVNEVAATRDEYPAGYIISGTATQVYGISVSVLDRGQQSSFEWYLHRDGTKMLRQMEGQPPEVFNRVE